MKSLNRFTKIITKNKKGLKEQDFFEKWIVKQAKSLKDLIVFEEKSSDRRIMDFTGKFIKNILINKGYIAANIPSDGSVCDIWGYKYYNDYCHLIIIQAQGSIVRPNIIMKEKDPELDQFLLRLKHKFIHYPYYKDKPLLLSFGSLGLIVKVISNDDIEFAAFINPAMYGYTSHGFATAEEERNAAEMADIIHRISILVLR